MNKSDGVARMTIIPEKIRDVFKQGAKTVGATPTVSAKIPSTDKVDDFLQSAGYKGSVKYEESSGLLGTLIGSVLPILLLALLCSLINRSTITTANA